MANKMLIDAAHPEETRVVVLRGNRVEEFDFEAANKKQLRGNIYLAKVTRVEPSLQAAFIEYGGNRHGFLAFSEIHPDYCQIPVADRQALLEDEARAQRDEEEEESRPNRRSRRYRRGRNDKARSAAPDERISEPAIEDGAGPSDEHEAGQTEPYTADAASVPPDEMDAPHPETGAMASLEPEPYTADAAAAPDSELDSEQPQLHTIDEPSMAAHETPVALSADAPQGAVISEPWFEAASSEAAVTASSDDLSPQVAEAPAMPVEAREGADEGDSEEGEAEEETVEQLGGDAMEEVGHRAPRVRRHYKIQEVIKRRQVLLVQVVKEERGNKGAALTTYLSLAGRYSVLMPNTARGGGISRKITDSEDRQRLKEIAQALDVPDGMGVILRTAGAARGPAEVRRDFEYLLRMWESVRELTLKSSAPSLVYEEGSLIKRSIRDLYNKDVDDVVVAGDAGFAEARDYMKMLMPTHVGNVVPYSDSQPVFARFGVEQQLDAMFSNHVTLKSGGYLVINQTEALVAIDVNSGRSTREHNIEDTALRTNCEAADEVARQLRLRDLAGLIVVDFIDMEEGRNNRTVERRMKDALKNDRARIQVGRISHFGLLEMSRQRMRTGVLEGSTVICPHCAGAGTVRSTSSIALHVLRVLEDGLLKNAEFNLTVRTRTVVALYILNQKRGHLRDLEKRFGVMVTVDADDTLTGTAYHAVERGEPAVPPIQAEPRALVRLDSVPQLDFEDEIASEEVGEDEAEPSAATEGGDGESDPRRRRRRRRRRGGRESSGIDADAPQPSDTGLDMMASLDESGVMQPLPNLDDAPADEAGEPEAEGGPRRRARRGGRGRRRREDTPADLAGDDQSATLDDGSLGDENRALVAMSEPAESAAMPVASVAAGDKAMEAASFVAAAPSAPQPVVEPVAPVASVLAEAPAPVAPPIEDPDRPKRSGWWQRAKATLSGS